MDLRDAGHVPIRPINESEDDTLHEECDFKHIKGTMLFAITFNYATKYYKKYSFLSCVHCYVAGSFAFPTGFPSLRKIAILPAFNTVQKLVKVDLLKPY